MNVSKSVYFLSYYIAVKNIRRRHNVEENKQLLVMCRKPCRYFLPLSRAIKYIVLLMMYLIPFKWI